MAHLAIEDVSIVASKIIEDTRLASYTEKSTRYVVFDRNRFCRVPRLIGSRHARLYEETCSFLLESYAPLLGGKRNSTQYPGFVIRINVGSVGSYRD